MTFSSKNLTTYSQLNVLKDFWETVTTIFKKSGWLYSYSYEVEFFAYPVFHLDRDATIRRCGRLNWNEFV